MVSSWDKSLETGNPLIDRQHRQLIALLDELKDECESDTEVLRMLDKVMDFTISHFLCEQELMTEANYPPDATKTMVDQHKELKAYVRLRVLEFRENETFDVVPFQSFMINHLKVHEFGLDRRLADWIRQQRETSQAA